MGPFGFNEILIILVIILLLFGAKKIPELMKGLGKGVREFKEAKDTMQQEMEQGTKQKESSAVV
jgi:sec-independent protein translocase protein TatA